MQISIIIPAYNEEANLETCVASVMAGLDSSYEILIVDDGSSDNTVLVAQRLERHFPSVRLLRHQGNVNRGVAATRNLGLHHATGELLAFIDADDICRPSRFIQSFGILQQRQDIDGVLVSVEVIFDEGADDRARAYLPNVLDHDPRILPGDFAAATLQGRSKFHISNMIFRKTLLIKSGVFNAQRKLGEEDTDLWLRMALCGRFDVADISEPQIIYRRHVGNNWHPNRNDVFRDLMVVGEVLKWAKTSPYVTTVNLRKLESAFAEKLFYCFTLACTNNMLIQGARTAILGAIIFPKLLIQRRYWGNVLRLTKLAGKIQLQ